MHVLIKLMKRRMRQPRLIKMQGVDGVAKLFFNHLDVVNHAVIGALRQGQNAGLFIFDLAGKRIRIDFFLDIFKLKLSQRNRPNNAHVVARRAQKHRDSTRHGDGMQN